VNALRIIRFPSSPGSLVRPIYWCPEVRDPPCSERTRRPLAKNVRSTLDRCTYPSGQRLFGALEEGREISIDVLLEGRRYAVWGARTTNPSAVFHSDRCHVSLLVPFLVNSERPPDWPSDSRRRLFPRTRVPSTKSGVAPRAASRKARAAGGREVARWRSAGTLYVAQPGHETDALWSLPRRFPKLVLFP
jgi:hypothetical protein